MQNLWAPWREQYITKVIRNQHKGCVFCRMLKARNGAKEHIFLRSGEVYAVLNIYPYSNGHCLIVPNRHVDDISKMTREEMAAMMDVLLKTKAMLSQVLKPHGFNVGFNLGRIAGAGIPGHVHMHIVPRWKGDHNFMPVTGGTKVISQSLGALYKALTAAGRTGSRRSSPKRPKVSR